MTTKTTRYVKPRWFSGKTTRRNRRYVVTLSNGTTIKLWSLNLTAASELALKQAQDKGTDVVGVKFEGWF
jgi:hypothetical protein